MICGA